MTLDSIRAITDPVARAKAAQEYLKRYLDEGHAVAEDLRSIRDRAMAEMRTGMSQREVAATLGLSVGRVAQVDKEQGVKVERRVTAPPPPEQ